MNDKNIIIIGNGCSLLDQQKGNTIDEFNEIVRFNNFSLKTEFHGDCGQYTTQYVINHKIHKSYVKKKRNISVESYKNIFVVAPNNKKINQYRNKNHFTFIL